MEYWKAIYTKDNIRKKRKRFTDGFIKLNTQKRTAFLFNEDGKQISNGRNVTVIDDQDRELQYLFLNSLYIELDYRISEKDFESGVCFENMGNVVPIQ
jgi:hypothetical protein